MPPLPEELAGQLPQFGDFELLGQGGMGAVYKARQKGLDRMVAIKILPTEISHDPAFAERFTREARALAKLNHPNIVAVYDFGQTSAPPSSGTAEGENHEGLYYLVMEFVDGVNLRQAIQDGKLIPKEALAIVPQICEALQFAHDEGIVHRDIKPENILVDKRGRVKIADFGLAKILGQETTEHLTATQQVMGTLRYMAPEQMKGSRVVDHRADIYSLGVVFYEMLTGELPVGRFAPPSQKVQIDVRLDEVVLRALENELDKRYQKASDIKTDVESINHLEESKRPQEVQENSSLKNLPPEEEPPWMLDFWTKPRARYAKDVGWPLLVLTGLCVLFFGISLLMWLVDDRYLPLVAASFGLSLMLLPWGLVFLNLFWLVRILQQRKEIAPANKEERDRRVLRLLRKSKIKAIRRYRLFTGAGLTEAQLAVEEIGRRHGISKHLPSTSGILKRFGLNCLGLVIYVGLFHISLLAFPDEMSKGGELSLPGAMVFLCGMALVLVCLLGLFGFKGKRKQRISEEKAIGTSE